MARGVTRVIRFILDRKSAEDSTRQMEKAFEKAGKESGENFYRELRKQFDKVTAELREKLAKGTIDITEFRRRSEEAARIFNQSMLRSLDEARAKGALTDREYIKLTKTLKNVGDVGQNAFGRMKSSMNSLWSGGLGQWIGTGAIFLGLRRANEAAIALDASQRLLGATSQITGVNFDFLADTAERANEKFGFGTQLANNFTIELTKLASKAGELSKVSSGLESFLDIGAARGLDAASTLVAVRQAILGIDEGTDKLFGKNPSVLYKEYGDQIGVAATKLTDQQKAQAILNAAIQDGEKVRGEYQKWLTTVAGQQFLLTVEVEQTSAAFGKALQPALVAILPIFSLLARAFTGLIEVLQDLGRVLTSGVLHSFSLLTDAAGYLARGHALVLEAATAVAEFLHADKTAVAFRERANAINAEARALHAYAEAAREVAKETEGERGRAFGGRASDGAPGTPPRLPPTSPSTGDDDKKGDRIRFWSWQGVGNAKGKEIGGGLRDGVIADPAVNETQAEEFASPWVRALELIEDQSLQTQSVFAQFGQALAEGGLKGLAKLALAKARENLAYAIEYGARAIGLVVSGNGPLAALAVKTAAGHAAAAAAWKLAGAGLGGGGSSSSSAVSSAGAPGNIGGSAAADVQPKNEVHIYIDPLSSSSPRAVRVIGDIVKKASTQDSSINIHPYSSSGRS